MKNFKNIFAFTFRQYAKSKRFIALTVIVALILFAAPAVILPIVEATSSDDGPTESYNVKTLFLCDATDGEKADLSLIFAGTPFEHVSVTDVGTYEEAKALSENAPESLIFLLNKDENGYFAEILTPEGSVLTSDDADTLTRFIRSNMRTILLLKSGLTYDQLLELARPTDAVAPEGSETENDASSLDLTRQIISMVLPLLYVFVLYFMLIFYGQGVATGVIVEKSSKLMDTFLVSVRPTEMVFGKMLAISLTGLLQFSIWIASLILGFTCGTQTVKSFSPDTDMGIIQFFDMIGEMKELFSPAACIVAVLFACVGFVLYCSLAAVGGAVSEKAEDLSSNNMIFTLVLCVSFCVALFTNPMYTGAKTTPAFLDYIPFTAILTVPCKAILGDISLWGSIVSLIITALAAFLISMAAGKLYKTFALYKGKSLFSFLAKNR